MLREKKTVSWRVCFFLPVSLFKLWQKVLLKCSSSMLLENFQKICRETTAMETILGRFKLFKMDSGKGVLLSVFRTPFYGCFQSLNINAFLCTAWKLSKYGVSSGPYFLAFELSPYSVRMRENTDQKKLRIWTIFTQCWTITLFGAELILQSCQRFEEKWKLFLIKCSEILRCHTFLFSLSANFTFFLKCDSLQKKSRKLKRFFCKDQSP